MPEYVWVDPDIVIEYCDADNDTYTCVENNTDCNTRVDGILGLNYTTFESCVDKDDCDSLDTCGEAEGCEDDDTCVCC
jgi:hypothetical protein